MMLAYRVQTVGVGRVCIQNPTICGQKEWSDFLGNWIKSNESNRFELWIV